MSVVNFQGVRVPIDDLPRGPCRVWDALRDDYCHGDPRRMRLLAAFVLHELDGWTVELIGLAFCVDKGNVSRWIQQVRRELREHFRAQRTADYEPTSTLAG